MHKSSKLSCWPNLCAPALCWMLAATLLAGLPATAAPAKASSAASKKAAPPSYQTACNGVFSDGTTIRVSAPENLAEVPGQQSFCDFHTFAWNQFIYLTQTVPAGGSSGPAAPRFLQLAPWYNVLLQDGSRPPSAYPGGDTSLKGGKLSKGQAGVDDELVDVNGSTVLYDIRFNQAMYAAIVNGGLYTAQGFQNACVPDAKSGVCAKPMWLPPVSPKQPANLPGSLEIKTAWRDFHRADACPADFYCNGRFGLVGMHLVQKTVTHGEWIWASFEHVANAPDCTPDGDTPIAPASPLGKAWSFFNPAAAGHSVMNSRTCSVTSADATACNTDPRVLLGAAGTYKAVNICRTLVLPPGGASAQNCAVPAQPKGQADANNAGNVACLNATLQPQLQGVWKNYKLVGSLWLRGKTAPNQQFRVLGFQPQASQIVAKVPVGFPHLANTTMETWMQVGSTGYDPENRNKNMAGCFACHNLPSAYLTGKPNEKRSQDLSHFPRRFPADGMNRFLKALVPADSSDAPPAGK